MMRKKIAEMIREACETCKTKGIIPHEIDIEPIIETPREVEFGDYSTNIAFILAPKLRKNPFEIAEIIISHLNYHDVCKKVEFAGKGFINFFVKDELWRSSLLDIYRYGIDDFLPDIGKGKKVLIEFVSANPTGPLHIGHGRGAVVGDVLANILKSTGYKVVKEYYINDAGKQINTLGESTYLRWKELKGESVDYPKDFYQGVYVKEFAAELIEKNIPVSTERLEAVKQLAEYSGGKVMKGIQEDLEGFGVYFDNYFRESTLFEKGIVDETLELLKSKGLAYEKDEALWFKTGLFENDEDRVLVKSDGEKTYFASDIAYHRHKLERGFELLIDLWGSDHHGYIPRLRASLDAIAGKKDRLKVILIQFVTLLKDGKPVGMSTRAGQFTTLKDVLGEVGKDAARFFFLMRKSDAHLEFDLDLAKKTSNENPVFYVQYANARIESIFRNAEEDGIDTSIFIENEKKRDANINVNLDILTSDEEITLIKGIHQFYDVMEGCARTFEPHRLTFYLIELVGRFHSYYNKTRVLKNEIDTTISRLFLLFMLQKIIQKGLYILGVSAPERM
ncbi:MAG: Arginine--tRNA ligase [Deltaproteobacteria bacterium ADurb.Bin026]|nr:MAG: Arginine--tRNA ligase [Deltaproteobacteria bacterium ADurb.Bin026]